MLILSNDEIARLLTMEGCMSALDHAYREQAAGRAVNQRRYDTIMSLPHLAEVGARYELKTMAGILPSKGVAALRMSSTLTHAPTPGGTGRIERLYLGTGGTTVGLVQLYATETGEPLAFMPDGMLQGMRVGGTFGLALRDLARTDASRVGLLGSGWQARFLVAAARVARPISYVKVFSPSADHRTQFAIEMRTEHGIDIQAVESPEDAADGADILMTATNSRAPTINRSLIRPGMVVTTLQKNELASDALEKFDRVVVHSSEQFQSFEGGTGQFGTPPQRKANLLDYSQLPLLEDVIAGMCPGRTSDRETILFEGSSGLGIQFAAVAALAYELARQTGVGREIPTTWFTQTLHT